MVQVFRVVTLRDRGIRYRYFEGTYQIIIKCRERAAYSMTPCVCVMSALCNNTDDDDVVLLGYDTA